MSDNPRRVNATDQLLIRYEISHAGKVLEGGLGDGSHQYAMGEGQWPEQIETEMLGLKQGDKTQLNVKAADNVFGEPNPERIVQMNRLDFTDNPDLGELIEFELPDGQVIEGQVLSIFNDNIEVDFNHPYAGRDITMQIHVESIISRAE